MALVASKMALLFRSKPRQEQVRPIIEVASTLLDTVSEQGARTK